MRAASAASPPSSPPLLSPVRLLHPVLPCSVLPGQGLAGHTRCLCHGGAVCECCCCPGLRGMSQVQWVNGWFWSRVSEAPSPLNLLSFCPLTCKMGRIKIAPVPTGLSGQWGQGIHQSSLGPWSIAGAFPPLQLSGVEGMPGPGRGCCEHSQHLQEELCDLGQVCLVTLWPGGFRQNPFICSTALRSREWALTSRSRRPRRWAELGTGQGGLSGCNSRWC